MIVEVVQEVWHSSFCRDNLTVKFRICSLPLVSEVMPSYQGDILIQSGSESRSFSVPSMDPSQLFVVSPTIEFVEGSTLPSANNPTVILVAESIDFPPGEWPPLINLGQSDKHPSHQLTQTAEKLKKSRESFVVWGIIESAGNQTVDNAVEIGPRPGPRK